MNPRKMAVRLLVACIAFSAAGPFSLSPAHSEDAVFQTRGADAVARSLEKLTGKKVTLRLLSGEEVTGTVRSVGDVVVHVGELQQREFFDALIRIDSIAAVIVRVK